MADSLYLAQRGKKTRISRQISVNEVCVVYSLVSVGYNVDDSFLKEKVLVAVGSRL